VDASGAGVAAAGAVAAGAVAAGVAAASVAGAGSALTYTSVTPEVPSALVSFAGALGAGVTTLS
jgi:hypothetical protein